MWEHSSKYHIFILFLAFECVNCQSVEIVSEPYFYIGEQDFHLSCSNFVGFDQVDSIKFSFNDSDIVSLTYNRTAASDQIKFIDLSYRDRAGLSVNGSLDEMFLNMTIERSHAHCNDSGLYKCTASGTGLGVSISVPVEGNITGKVRPTSIQPIAALPSGDVVGGVNVYDGNQSLILNCSSDVDDGTQEHRWCIKKENDTNYQVIIPDMNSTTINTTLSYQDCLYRRSTTMDYIVTDNDTMTSFICEVPSSNSTCGTGFLSVELKIRLRRPEDGDGGGGGGGDGSGSTGANTVTEDDSNLGVIAGGVVGGVAAVFILGCLVYKCRQGKRDSNYAPDEPARSTAKADYGKQNYYDNPDFSKENTGTRF